MKKANTMLRCAGWLAVVAVVGLIIAVSIVVLGTEWKQHEVRVFLSGRMRSRLVKVVFHGSIWAGTVVVRSPAAIAYLQRAFTSGGEPGIPCGQEDADLYFDNAEHLAIYVDITRRHIYLSDNYFIVSDDFGWTSRLPVPVPAVITRLRRWLNRNGGKPPPGGKIYF